MVIGAASSRSGVFDFWSGILGLRVDQHAKDTLDVVKSGSFRDLVKSGSFCSVPAEGPRYRASEPREILDCADHGLNF